jgi:magnesium transporter
VLSTYPDGDLESAAWIDLREPTEDECAKVQAATGLRVPGQAEISEIESSSRLRFDGSAFRLSAPLVGHATGGPALTPVGFVLSSRVLLTVHYGPLSTLEAASEDFATRKVRTAEEAFLRILEIVVDRAADKLELAGAECDGLARTAFGTDTGRRLSSGLRATLAHIGRVSEDVSRVRDSLLVLGRIADYVESAIPGAPRVDATRTKAIRSDVASLTDYQAHLSGKTQFLLDATLGFINIEQNEIVKILTIGSVVGIPPVLVAGIYGMNFRVMPELSWGLGYPMALVLIVASALLPLVWFKRRNWI